MLSTSSQLRFPASTLGSRRRAAIRQCHNLRKSSTLPDTLEQTGEPAVVASASGATAVQGGHFKLSTGVGCTVFHRNGSLQSLAGGTILTICPLSALPRCVVALDDGDTLLVMPGEGRPMRFRFDGSAWKSVELFPTLPPLMLTRRDMGTVTADTLALTLKGTYTTSSRSLTDIDTDTLDAEMRRAYIRMSDTALSHGCFIQPVMARYRLVGDGGVTLHTSAPVIVAPDAGCQAVKATFTATGDGFRTASSAHLSATEFRIGLTATAPVDNTWRTLVRSVEILVSPQLHPLSMTLPGSSSRTGMTSTQLTFTHSLPGINPLETEGTVSSRAASTVTALLDTIDTSLRVYSETDAVVSTSREIDRIESLINSDKSDLSDTSDSSAAMERAISAPHTFTAGTASRNGDMIALGNLRAVPFDGYPMPQFAASTSTSVQSTPTSAVVEMKDGSTVANTANVASRAINSISPLIVYPSPDAVSATLTAGTRRITLPLTPTPGRRWAYSLSPTLAPQHFDTEISSFTVPTASPRPRDFPSGIAFVSASAPLTPLVTTRGPSSPVVSILPSPRHSSSFTVPSARFFVLSRASVHSMALTDSRRRINLNMLSTRGIDNAMQATAIPRGIAAVCGQDIVTFTGSSETVIVKGDVTPSSMLAWSDSFDELWAIPPFGSDNPVLVTSPDGSTLFSRTNPGISSIVSGGSSLRLFTSAGAILDPDNETTSTPATVQYICTIPVTGRPGSRQLLTLPLSADTLTGTVSLIPSHQGDDTGSLIPSRQSDDVGCRELLKLALSSVTPPHPLVIPLRLPHSHFLTLRLTLTGRNIHLL